MIALCFRGVGATSLAKTDIKYIDLNSDLFWIAPYTVMPGNYHWDKSRWGNWQRVAGNIAESLSATGHTVLCPADPQLIDRLEGIDEDVALIFPALGLKEEWLKRFEKCPAILAKAYDELVNAFDSIEYNKIRKIKITDINFKLEDLLEGDKANG